ncbi:class I SAM-dependent DNA methyltransferase [Flavobacterium humi]|uniref:Class I SAM-dependent methyltransferase n=1 Tax=Flavobacterium humi TaxID=2562683 RepID=A0A4Z0LAM1_9FLAO|nr:class I SAM-dependent methyltransferase [Flavobacterium humi]TGD59072.1 class I SAM-dependent methyltransferase [Flavobacterium humi]
MDKTEIAVNIFNTCAREYQDRFMEVDLYHNALDIFCNTIAKQNAEILELACGPGNITQYVLQERPGFKILGTDLAPNMIELAKTNNPSAGFQLMDCRDILSLHKKYDGIICGFALPYLSKTAAGKLFADAFEALHPNGTLYISTMEETQDNKSGFKNSSDGQYRAYVYYHKADHLIRSLEKNGFNILYFHRQDYPATDGTKTVDLLIIAQKP